MKKFGVLAVVCALLLATSVVSAEGITLKGGAWFVDVDGSLGADANISAWEPASLDATFGEDDTNYYIAGSGDFGKIGVTGFYGTASASNPKAMLDISVSDTPFESLSGTLDGASLQADAFYGLAGWNLGAISVGGGWAYMDHLLTVPLFDDDTVKVKGEARGDGFAVGAFGSYPLAEKVDVFGTLYYVPWADIMAKASVAGEGLDISLAQDFDGSMWGLDVGVSYSFTETFGIEAGYRNFELNADQKTLLSIPGLIEIAGDGSTAMDGFYVGAKVVF